MTTPVVIDLEATYVCRTAATEPAPIDDEYKDELWEEFDYLDSAPSPL